MNIENIYFTEAYGETFSLPEDSYFKTFSSSQNNFELPLIVRRLPNGFFSAQSPYGYPGIKIQKGIDFQETIKEWQDFLQSFKEAGIVHIKIKFPPFLPQEAKFVSSLPGVEIHKVGETIFVPKLAAQENWESMEGRARTSVRKALKNQLNVEISAYNSQDSLPGSHFRELYDETMARKEASPFYFFDDQYFGKIESNLNNHIFKVIVTDEVGLPLAGCLFLTDTNAAHYHLSGSTIEGARLGANNLMLWALIEYVANSSLNGSHLGGGIEIDDSLFRFKKSFGGNTIPFHIGSIITDEKQYLALSQQKADELDVPLSQILAGGFFPAFETPENFLVLHDS